MIGTHLGPYAIVAKIRQGGMGDVYRARTCASIALLPSKCSRQRSRATKSFAAGSTVKPARSRPSRIPISARCTTLAAKGRGLPRHGYLDGQTLAELLANRPLLIEEWLRLAIQVATALEAAHDRHVLHRDIKPGNIFVTSRGLAKVLDFGLAKRLLPASQSSLVATFAATDVFAGTLDYMSPEQARGRELDLRSDLFSFGTVLYEMATRRHPFRGADFIETLDRIANRPRAPIAKVSEHGSQSTASSVGASRRMRARYASASELLKDLRALERASLSGRSTSRN